MLNLKSKIRIFIAILLLLFIPLWLGVFSKEILKLPNDLNIDINVESFDDFYSIEDGEYSGEISSVTEFKYKAVDLNEDVLNVMNSFDVKTLSGEEIFSVEREYFIDVYSGKHTDYREGYLFAPRMKKIFDRSLDKQSFNYWHVNYDTPINLDFRSTEDISGIETYIYESNFLVDQTRELTGVLDRVGEETGIILDVHIKVWVEPYTGRIIKYEDNAEAFYYSIETNERLYPWNRFRNNTSPASVVLLTKEISIEIQEIIFYEYIIPIFLLVLALILLFLPLIIRIFSRLLKNTNASYKNLMIPGLVLLLGISVTIFLFEISRNVSDQQIRAEFEKDVSDIRDSIEDRLGLYANVLRGGRGLFDASNEVSRSEWKAYTDSLSLQSDYPGIQGVGYSEIVLPEELENFEEKVKEEGFPDFKVTPDNERDIYTSILFLEPFDARNKLAFGYDMFSEKTRRDAMEFARDSGEISISKKVKLLQEGSTGTQAGFLMYEPFYDISIREENIESRRETILGYVYAPFRMDNLMIGIFSKDNANLGVEIYDGRLEELDEEQFMYKNNLVNDSSELNKTESLQLFNNYWTIRYTAPEGYGFDPIRNSMPAIILIFGFILSASFFIFLYILNTRRVRAVKYADEVTKDLKIEKENVEKYANELQKFRQAVDNATDQIVITDPEGIVIYGNNAMEKTTGYSVEEAIGKKAGSLWKIPMPKSYYQRMWKTIKEDKKPFVDVLKNKHKNGREYDASVTIFPVLNDVNEVIFFVSIERDVTKEKEIDRAKTEFVSLASHQLRTPLSAIKWYAEMLLNGDVGKISEGQKEYLLEIYNGNERMVSLVNALLNVSRIDLGTFAIESEDVDPIKILRQEIENQKHPIEVKKLKINENLEEFENIKADIKMLGIIFQNLISNAVKYTPPKGSIDISLKNKNKKDMEFIVKDTGYGIPKAQQDKIFTKLFRADNIKSSDTDGTGLGLYILKSIIEHVGGKISFKSEENKGSEFRVIIPKIMKNKEGEKSLS